MPKETQSDPRNNFVPRFLPWLLGLGMLVVYWFTLNHWVTLLNLPQVAAVSGWTWQAQVFNPLTYLVTRPFRFIPVAQVPLALNVFSSFCAAATLAVLARSVAILPHDRTEMERNREKSDFSFLTGWTAWVPPITAVIFCGLQLGFWEHATSFTGESFELLWFAIILWQVLEYRLDEKEWRLYLAAFLYGAGMTEDWALVAFFPVFLMVIIWLRKLDFFSMDFLIRMTLCGLAGLLFLLVLPIVTKISFSDQGTVWAALKPNLRSAFEVVKSIQVADVRSSLALMSLTSLVPAFVMAIRWSSSFGDSSKLGSTLVNYTIHVVNGIFFAVLVWATFDPPFSARKLTQELLPTPALSLYYIGALCIGYYCGYVMLIFGVAPTPTRRNPRPDPALPKALLWFCPVIVAGALACIVMAAGLLINKNMPLIRDANDDSLMKYAQFTTRNLPKNGAILFCDSDNPARDQPTRAALVQAELVREGRFKDYPVVDTQALNWTFYHEYLHKHFPGVWPQAPAKTVNGAIPMLQIYNLLGQLAQSNTLCYLNPSFGYYFEQFYQEPHGLSYALKAYPKDTLLAPELSRDQLAENESFWNQLLESCQPAIEKALHPRDPSMEPGVIAWFLMHLHIAPEPNPNALMVASIYSRSLNDFGVQAQRAGELEKARTLFSTAQKFNSNNVVATINLNFNSHLREGMTNAVSLSRVTSDLFGKYNNWNEVLNANGPFDEPSFCFENGCNLMQSGLNHQALDSFNRVRQLAPDNLATRLFMGQIYIFSRLPEKALEALADPLEDPARFALTETNSTELNILAASAYFQKNEDAKGAALLEKEVRLHPNDGNLLLAAAQSLNMRHLYTNSLHVINAMLAQNPNDPQWVYGKGYVSLQVGAYDDAVKALTQFLNMATNNPDALYNRGYAYFKSGHLDAARADFLRLQAIYTNDFHVAFGLGEIAWRKHETNEAIRNYQIFTANAPTNTFELKTAREHLTQLGGN